MNKSSDVHWPESPVPPDLLALHIRKRQKRLQAIQPNPMLHVSHHSVHIRLKKMPKSDATQMHLKKDKVEVGPSEFHSIVTIVPEAKSMVYPPQKMDHFQNSC